jgi:hypothetical protein
VCTLQRVPAGVQPPPARPTERAGRAFGVLFALGCDVPITLHTRERNTNKKP